MSCDQLARSERIHTVAAPTETSTFKDTPAHQPPQNPPLPHSWHACKKVINNRGQNRPPSGVMVILVHCWQLLASELPLKKYCYG